MTFQSALITYVRKLGMFPNKDCCKFAGHITNYTITKILLDITGYYWAFMTSLHTPIVHVYSDYLTGIWDLHFNAGSEWLSFM